VVIGTDRIGSFKSNLKCSFYYTSRHKLLETIKNNINHSNLEKFTGARCVRKKKNNKKKNTCGRSVVLVISRTSTNKTDCHDITELLLKVALNTIKTINIMSKSNDIGNV
jgi:hypothetical protein